MEKSCRKTPAVLHSISMASRAHFADGLYSVTTKTQEIVMKKLAYLVYCTAACLLLTSGAATADKEYDYDYGYRWHDHQNSLVGAWKIVITLRFFDAVDCTNAPVIPDNFGPNPFPAFFTFHEGGTMGEWGARVSPARRSSGHGIWERTSRRNYVYSHMFHSFDEMGVLVATMDWQSDLALAKGGQTFESISRLERYNLDGTVLKFCATVTGERINL
jgi:hypothetical protein